FDRLDREKHLSKLLHLLVFLGRKELLLFAGARLGDVDRRENALLGEQAIQGDLAVSRPLELLENYLIHAAAGVDQRGTDDGQGPRLLGRAGGPEDSLRPLERPGIHAACARPAGAVDLLVVGARQPGDTVAQIY